MSHPNLPDPGENGSAAEMDARAAAKFRSRVVETARAILPTVSSSDSVIVAMRTKDRIAAYAFEVAEAFESAAAEYLRDGGAK